MLKGRMSLLTMSLLAITVAATIAHAARLDSSLKTMANEPNLKSVAGGPFIPYLECIAKCDECTTCTKVMPMWKNFCVCVIYPDSKKPALQNSPVEEQVLQVKGKSEEHPGVQQTRGEAFPYAECNEKCKVLCACLAIEPPPAYCYCADPIESSTSTLRLDTWLKTMANEPDLKSVADASAPKKIADTVVQRAPIAVVSGPQQFPYAECNEKCKVVCACLAIEPPPAYCTCFDPIESSTSTLAATIAHAARLDTSLKTMANEPDLKSVADASAPKKIADTVVQRAPIAVVSGPQQFPSAECNEKCKFACACLPIWPPPAYCWCSDPIESSTSTLEEAKESHTKFDLLAGPVEKVTEGGDFIPYPECIAKCDECPVCTLPYPIEMARCLCVNHTDSASSKKPALQNSGGDDKQVVLWTKAKMETIPYKECIETCTLCACTLPWPPEFASCICVTPKPQAAAAGKALPM